MNLQTHRREQASSAGHPGGSDRRSAANSRRPSIRMQSMKGTRCKVTPGWVPVHFSEQSETFGCLKFPGQCDSISDAAVRPRSAGRTS